MEGVFHEKMVVRDFIQTQFDDFDAEEIAQLLDDLMYNNYALIKDKNIRDWLVSEKAMKLTETEHCYPDENVHKFANEFHLLLIEWEKEKEAQV